MKVSHDYMLCYSTNFTNVKMKIDIFPAGSVENMYDCCQQIYCAKKKKPRHGRLELSMWN